jgi:alpha,alpha-trehalase
MKSNALRLCLLIAWSALGQAPAPAPEKATPAQLQEIQAYIKQTWHTLSRSNARLAVAAVDPKSKALPDGRWPVYISPNEDADRVELGLHQELAPEAFAKIKLVPLPADVRDIQQQGLLYLPHPYVVPGGRFNEMYGWDSYFIQAGLVQDDEFVAAKDMADNFLYEIKNYGRILNANRTYYLTRSQPPFLTQMLLAVYRHTQDKKWLAEAVPQIESYYRFWTTEPHLVPETGLSRYFDLGDGPAPEVVSSERDAQGRTHYDLIEEYLRTHDVPDFDVSQYYDRATNTVTPLFYKGDRSMRESGFDPSNRFGPFNLDIIHYNPVCLNSLLYLMEKQTAEIMTILGRGSEAPPWEARAEARRKKINELMWDEKDGLYYDYNFQTHKLRPYPFLTTFYPLWAGIADAHRAERVMKNLSRFEQPGGLETSTFKSGNQWDAPFGWAPLQLISVEGLRRYGYTEAADRITAKFLSVVLKSFLESHTIVEKYDVVRRSTDVSSNIGYGYRTNEAGFGWTNATFLKLYDELSPKAKGDVLKLRWESSKAAAAAPKT